MLKLKLRDFIKGAIMAILVPILYIIQSSVSNGVLTFNWKEIGIAAISGLVAYLIKNLFTDDVKAAQKVLSDAKLEGKVAAEPIPPVTEAEKVDISNFPPSGTIPTGKPID